MILTSYYLDDSVIIISVNEVYNASNDPQVAVNVGIDVKNPIRNPLEVETTRIYPFSEKDLN